MSEEVLLIEKKDHICTLTINRPDRRNALTLEILYRLGDTFRTLGDDKDVRVVVLTGAGEKAFSSGMDLGGGGIVSAEEMAQKGNPIDYAVDGIINYPFPVIAMVNGAAMGAGCDMAVTCDLRVAADTAKMGINPVKLGGVYHPPGIQRLMNVVGLPRAKELFYTGRFIDAQRAERIGLVDYVVPLEELPTKTYELAEEIAGNAPLAVSATKKIFNKLLKYQRMSPEDEAEAMALVDAADKSEDRSEGFMAFMAKRKPEFKGK